MAQEPARFPGFTQVVSRKRIQEAVRSLATAVAADHPDESALVIVAVLKGAVIFLADLIRHLPVPTEIEFVKVRSYDGTRRREVAVLDNLGALPVSRRHVLLLDCVLDTGRTLAALQERIHEHRPASLRTCVLLSKRRARDVPVTVDYTGLQIPDVFVVGYGLDHANRWRHLPYVAEYNPDTPDQGGAEA